jgi:flavin reductase (DIM6/NTAB) family NADH-FMN oxidoreductase RutF
VLRPDEVYALLRHLTPPVAAVTTSAGGRHNGFIINSAQRASLVPELPRISFYCSKTNHSHDMILDGGVFTIHLLRSDQWLLIERFGLQSAREGTDKLAEVGRFTGGNGCPVLTDCVAAFECEVINAMDAGAATFLLGEVHAVHAFDTDAEVMTSERFRLHMPHDLRVRYEANLRHAQQALHDLARHVDRGAVWQGPRTGP